jgi:peptidoglycan/LPS O-acetylase OafA/YrhL
VDRLENPVARGSQATERPDDVASRPLTYQPALDGVRAVAVVLVVIFHLDVGIFDGGYLGVSVFFTLSGFLITSLLVDEWNLRADTAQPGLDLGRFYVRRIKRLLPASIATLLAVAALAALELVARTSSLQGDLTAAAWNVYNWNELWSGQSYAALFQEESPVAHYWSLAIEEQFYLVWPLTMLFLMRRCGLGRSGLLRVLGGLYAATALTAVLASPEVAYFATWTRAAEILAGALLAVWMSTSARASWPGWWRWLPGPALATIVIASILTPTATGWAYAGGLPVFALVSTALIAGLQMPGPTKRALSWLPLVALGKVSYGVYLVHWPVFVVLDEERLGVGGWSLAMVRLAVTGVITVVMFFVLERPIRLSKPTLRPLAVAALAVLAMVTVTLAAYAVRDTTTVAAPAPAVLGAGSDTSTEADVAASTSTVAGSAGPTDAPATTVASGDVVEASNTTTTTVAPPEPTTVAVFGDSVPAWLLRDAAASFRRTDVVVLNGAQEACDGMVDLPVGRDRRGTELFPPDDCFDWTISYPETLSTADETDVGLLVVGQAPVIDRQIDGEWQGPCDSIDWYLDDLANRVEYLREQGVRPVLAIPARYGQRVSFMVEDDHLERIACVRSAMLRFAADHDVGHIDLDQFLCPNDDCDARRDTDGIHIDPEFAPLVLDELLDGVLELTATDPPS